MVWTLWSQMDARSIAIPRGRCETKPNEPCGTCPNHATGTQAAIPGVSVAPEPRIYQQSPLAPGERCARSQPELGRLLCLISPTPLVMELALAAPLALAMVP